MVGLMKINGLGILYYYNSYDKSRHTILNDVIYSKVFVRVRPLNQSEKHQRSCSIVDTQGTKEGEKCTTLLVYKYYWNQV